MSNQYLHPWTESEDQILRESYGTKSYKDIAKMLVGRSRTAVKVRCFRLNLQRPKDNVWTDDECQIILDNYSNNPHIMTLLPGRTWESIKQKARKLGVKVKYGTYKFDNQFFGNMTEKSAYVAGFFAADGYLNITANRLELCLQKRDEGHLQTIATAIGYTGPLYQKPKAKAVRLQVTSTQLLEDLIEILGVRNNKTLALHQANIPDELLRHFIRGYIDGDGSIRPNYPTLRILGTIDFLTWIDSIIQKKHETKNRKPKKKGHENVYELSYNGTEMLNVCKWLYSDATIYLNRKYQRYVKLLSEHNSAKRHTSKKLDEDIVDSARNGGALCA